MRHRTTRALAAPALALLALALSALGLAACSPEAGDGAGDAPILEVQQEPWLIINNVDGYPNISHRCVGPNGIYTTRSANDASDTMTVIANDANCTDEPR